MNGERLSFRWNNFEDNLQDFLREVHKNEILSDVTLVGDDGAEIHAHKFVLCASSLFFSKLLQDRIVHPHPLLYIKGVNNVELSSILEFIYNGEVSISQDDMEKYFEIAADLQIKGLSRENLEPIYTDVKESDESDADTVIYSQISKSPSQLLHSYEEMGSTVMEDKDVDKAEVYVPMDEMQDKTPKKVSDESDPIYFREGQWYCKFCKKAETKKSKMKCHLQTHGIIVFQHRCDYCGKSFKSKQLLKIHKYKLHTSDKILQQSLMAMT